MSEDANANPGPPGAGEPGDDFLSEEEFRERMKDPAFARAFEEEMRRVVASPPGEYPPELVASARVALEKRRAARALQVVTDKFEALKELLNRPGGSMEAEERLRQCNALMDELTDALLETPEPFRTQYLKGLLPIREQVRALRVPED